MRAAQQALQSCHYISTQLLNRATSGNATSSSRLIMQQHVIQLITSVFVDVLPKPLPGAPHYAGEGGEAVPGNEGKQMEPAAQPPVPEGGANQEDGPSDNLATWLDSINLSHIYDNLIELGATKVSVSDVSNRSVIPLYY